MKLNFAVLGLLSFSAFAAPSSSSSSASLSTTQGQNEAFTIPSIPNPSHVRDGPKAKRKVFRKMNWPLPTNSVPLKEDYAFKVGIPEVVSAASRSVALKASAAPNVFTQDKVYGQTGSVQSNPEKYGSEYISPVDIGTPPQTLHLDLDTGSADTWIFSSLQPKSETKGHNFFTPPLSRTWRTMRGETWSIRYGDGTGAHGVVGTDIMNVGGAVAGTAETGDVTGQKMGVRAQAVEIANWTSEGFVNDLGSDGIVALGFSNINSARPTRVPTLLDTLLPTLRQPLFTANLITNDEGSYDFGYLNTWMYDTSTLKSIPVDPSHGFWQFPSNTFTYGTDSQQLYINETLAPAIADTGTSLIIVDPPVAKAYYEKVPTANYSSYYDGYVFKCGITPKIPDFGIAVGKVGALNAGRFNNNVGQGALVTVPGSWVNYAPVGDGSGWCYGGVQSNGGHGVQVYGDLFFRSAFLVFYLRPGSQAIGVAKKSACGARPYCCDKERTVDGVWQVEKRRC